MWVSGEIAYKIDAVSHCPLRRINDISFLEMSLPEEKKNKASFAII